MSLALKVLPQGCKTLSASRLKLTLAVVLLFFSFEHLFSQEVYLNNYGCKLNIHNTKLNVYGNWIQSSTSITNINNAELFFRGDTVKGYRGNDHTNGTIHFSGINQFIDETSDIIIKSLNLNNDTLQLQSKISITDTLLLTSGLLKLSGNYMVYGAGLKTIIAQGKLINETQSGGVKLILDSLQHTYHLPFVNNNFRNVALSAEITATTEEDITGGGLVKLNTFYADLSNYESLPQTMPDPGNSHAFMLQRIIEVGYEGFLFYPEVTVTTGFTASEIGSQLEHWNRVIGQQWIGDRWVDLEATVNSIDSTITLSGFTGNGYVVIIDSLYKFSNEPVKQIEIDLRQSPSVTYKLEGLGFDTAVVYSGGHARIHRPEFNASLYDTLVVRMSNVPDADTLYLKMVIDTFARVDKIFSQRLNDDDELEVIEIPQYHYREQAQRSGFASYINFDWVKDFLTNFFFGCDADRIVRLGSNRNWIHSRYFNGLSVIAESVQYYDNLGRPTQKQKRDFSNGLVLAAETIYDAAGRPAIQTLPAPLGNRVCLGYGNFIFHGTEKYSAQHFDRSTANWNYNDEGKKFNPLPVTNWQTGTLGAYYSELNIKEPYVPGSQYPYVRTEYHQDNNGRIKSVTLPGEDHKLGSGHEMQTYTMPASGELVYLFGLEHGLDSYNPEYLEDNISTEIPVNRKMLKTIQQDPNGKRFVTYTDEGGNVVATCISGTQESPACEITMKAVYSIRKGGYIDIHLPPGKSAGLQVRKSIAADNFVIRDLTQQEFGDLLLDGSGINNLSGGFYRLTHIGNNTNTTSSTITISYELDYHNFTLYYYDKANRLKMIVPPQGIDCSYSPELQVVNEAECVSLENYVAENDNGTCSYTPTGLDIEIPEPPENDRQLVIANVFANNSAICGGTTVEGGHTHNFENGFTAGFARKGFSDGISFLDNNAIIDNVVERINSPLEATKLKIPQTGTLGTELYRTRACVSAMHLYAIYYNLHALDGNGRDEIIISNGRMNATATLYQGSSIAQWSFSNQISAIMPAWATDLHLEILGIFRGSFADNGNCSLSVTGNYECEDLNNDPLLNQIALNLELDIVRVDARPQHNMVSAYNYNSLNQVLWQYNPDDGRTDYLYRNDGQVRFSQNAKQKNQDRFSYVNYDELGRAVEVGEYFSTTAISGTPLTFQNHYALPELEMGEVSVFTMLNDLDGLDDARCRNWVKYYYDSADPDLTIAMPAFEQQNTLGKITKMESGSNNLTTSFVYNTIWYGYDENGRTLFSAQHSNGLGYKTMQYTYDIVGNLLKTEYQAGEADAFTHFYTYDIDGRLTNVKTQAAGETYSKPEAAYKYYTHGPLKRTELGDMLQGIDYTYTIHGWLKSINQSHITVRQLDPGKDGIGNGFAPDVFGMELDYYRGDYRRRGTISGIAPSLGYGDVFATGYTNQYNGNITGSRWQTQKNYGHMSGTYRYSYDTKDQLHNSGFGTTDINMAFNTPNEDMMLAARNTGPWGLAIANLALSNFTSAGDQYREGDIKYDRNGNIKQLKRFKDGTTTNDRKMDNLTYSYTASTNKLAGITDAEGVNGVNDITNVSYTYDAIGQMIQETEGSTERNYTYNWYGLVEKVEDENNIFIEGYNYDARGYLIEKYKREGFNIILSTHYVRDDGGNVIAVYDGESNLTSYPQPSNEISLLEYNIYGNMRHGVVFNNSGTLNRQYELADHLGNVRAVIAEAKVNGNAEIKGYNDYYPYGWTMPNRSLAGANYYRFGYQGQFAEKNDTDEENTFMLRRYDGRVGRWKTIDPYQQYNSPYLSMGNNPVISVDPDGGLDKVHQNSETGQTDIIPTNMPYDEFYVDGQFVGYGPQGLGRSMFPDAMTFYSDGGRLAYRHPELSNNDVFKAVMANNSSDASRKALYEAKFQIEREESAVAGYLTVGVPVLVIAGAELTLAATPEIISLGSSAMSQISTRTAQWVIRNESWLNQGQWWRLGMGKNLAGQWNIRLAWGAANAKHLKKVHPYLKNLNKNLRELWGGHWHFPNWK